MSESILFAVMYLMGVASGVGLFSMWIRSAWKAEFNKVWDTAYDLGKNHRLEDARLQLVKSHVVSQAVKGTLQKS